MSAVTEIDTFDKQPNYKKAVIIALLQEAISEVNEDDPSFFQRCHVAIVSRLSDLMKLVNKRVSASEKDIADVLQVPQYRSREEVLRANIDWLAKDFGEALDTKNFAQSCIQIVADLYHSSMGVSKVDVSPDRISELMGLFHIPPDDRSTPENDLIEEQYAIAEQYPGEYVILIGKEVFFHSSDRKESLEKYHECFEKERTHHPVFIEPDSAPSKTHPVFRGRALVGPENQQSTVENDL